MINQPKPLTMDEFNDWVRALHAGLRRFEALFDKLSIYEHKLVTGPSSNLKETIQKVGSNSNPFLHWILKIDETKEQLGDLEELVQGYAFFLAQLNHLEQALLSTLITRKISMTQLAMDLEISRTYLYQIRNELFQKWVLFYKQK